MTAGAARLCGSCGRIRPISKRAGADGPDICAGCYRPPTATCSGCGRLRPCTGIAAGQPLCSRCRFAQVHGVMPWTMPRCWGSVATTRISEVWLRLLEAYGL